VKREKEKEKKRERIAGVVKIQLHRKCCIIRLIRSLHPISMQLIVSLQTTETT
jgi:hypothetical protein